MRQRVETDTTRKHGGMHNRAGYRAFSKQITNNTFKKARLYHFVLKGIPNLPHPTVLDYRKAADTITRLLRRNKIDCFGKGAWEVNEVRGLHFHFMLVVEAEYGNVDYWLRVTEDGDLKTELRKVGVDVHVAKPLNDMHRVGGNKLGKMPLYQYITKSGPKLEDALKRISYIYKTDTKDDTMPRVYYSTRQKAKKAEAEPVVQQVAPAEQPATPNNEQEGEDRMNIDQLPPTAHSYIEGLYQGFVDKGLRVDQIRAALAAKGIKRTEGQVVYDLDSRYCFSGYAAANPAAPRLTYAELDAMEEAKAAKPARILRRSKDSSCTAVDHGIKSPNVHYAVLY